MAANSREGCPVAGALDVVGERWSLLIVRDLLLDGPRRFQDFSETLPGISPSILSKRLKSLDHHGIVERRVVDGHPPRTEYALTDTGKKLQPVVRALWDWEKARREGLELLKGR